MKETNVVKRSFSHPWRPGASYTMICPHCKYKKNKYSTAFNWDRVRVQCEKCNQDFTLINTDPETQSNTK